MSHPEPWIRTVSRTEPSIAPVEERVAVAAPADAPRVGREPDLTVRAERPALRVEEPRVPATRDLPLPVDRTAEPTAPPARETGSEPEPERPAAATVAEPVKAAEPAAPAAPEVVEPTEPVEPAETEVAAVEPTETLTEVTPGIALPLPRPGDLAAPAIGLATPEPPREADAPAKNRPMRPETLPSRPPSPPRILPSPRPGSRRPRRKRMPALPPS